MGALAKVFPDRKFDAEVFWVFLQDLTDEQFLKAVFDIVCHEKELYPGTNIISLIRSKAITDKRLLPGEAWGEVRREVKRVGYMGKPKFSGALVQKAVDCMGWVNICSSENSSVERAHFLKIYETLINREKHETQASLVDKVKIKLMEAK